jgi:hypothetical protein
LWFALLVVVGADEFDFMFELVDIDEFDFMFELLDIVVEFDEVELDGIVLAGVIAGVLAGIVFMLVLAGLVLALFVADSPQAIPSAPITRTAESAIAFFIVVYKLLFCLKD